MFALYIENVENVVMMKILSLSGTMGLDSICNMHQSFSVYSSVYITNGISAAQA